MSAQQDCKDRLIELICMYGASTVIGTMGEVIQEADPDVNMGFNLGRYSGEIDDNEYAEALELDDFDHEED